MHNLLTGLGRGFAYIWLAAFPLLWLVHRKDH